MVPRKTVHIVVKEDASVKIDYRNFTGTDCLTVGKQMHELLARLGVQVDQTDFTPKPELLAAQDVHRDVMVDIEVIQEMQTEE